MENKKKRGRKPKNKIIVNENPKFEQDKVENLISSLSIKKTTESFTIKESNNIDDIDYQLNENTCKLCWNCSEDICSNISHPINYINGTFYLNGSFCSYECAARHIFDTYHGKDLFNKYSLLNLYYNKIHNTCKKVKIAPEKFNLKKYGGTMNYEDYINNSLSYNIQNNYIPPIIYVSHSRSSHIKEDNIFKMYRKKEIKTNNLFKDIENQEKNLI